MRNDKFSYIVLLAEVVVIIYLHSVKTPETSAPVEQQVVAKTKTSPKMPVAIHRASFKTR